MTTYRFIARNLFALLLLSIFIVGCQEEDLSVQDQVQLENRNTIVAGRIQFYGLSAGNELIQFSSSQPGGVQSTMPITGLMANEWVIGIDFRPATGQLYGVTNQSRLYIIQTRTGTATPISANPFSPAIRGQLAGFDFNPTVDRIRLVTESGQNLRLHPETGAVAATDGEINPSGSSISAVAYTNSFAGATTTTLYDLDVVNGKLFKQIPPNDGTIVEVGSLGFSGQETAGFDISSDNQQAIAIVPDADFPGQSSLYSVNLTTGGATLVTKMPSNVIGLAIPTTPVAYAITMQQELMIFNPQNPASAIIKDITGLPRGERIEGIDMRPATGQLYLLGKSSRLYTINSANGAVTQIGTAPFSQRLNGTWFGFDFNPTVDRIRIVSNKGQNLRVHPVTGDIAVVDVGLNPGSPNVDAAAYTNNFAGATSTTLYVLDFMEDALYTVIPPNDGKLNYVGDLGWNIFQSSGFDIAAGSGNAMCIIREKDSNYLCQVDLTTGQMTIVSSFPEDIKGFTLGAGL